MQTGVRLSLDDFGRASSLAALRSRAAGRGEDRRRLRPGRRARGVDAAIVRNLVELARELELATVAKGVETRDAWDAVARMGCDRAQGFYLQRPLPAAEPEGLARPQLARRRRRRVAGTIDGHSEERERPPPRRAGSRPTAAAPAGARRAQPRRARPTRCRRTSGGRDPTAPPRAGRRRRRRCRRPPPAPPGARVLPTTRAGRRRGGGTRGGRSRRARSTHRRRRSASAPRSRRDRPRR